MSATTRRSALTIVFVGGMLSAACPLSAQQVGLVRTAVSVDYVGVEGVYLAVGADQGLAVGDTILVYADSGAAEAAGRVVLTSVTRRRALAATVGGSLRLERGDVVYLPLPRTDAPHEPSPVALSAEAAPAPAVAAGPRPARGPRISGRLALDFEARETRTAWTGDLFGETRRRFATPTSRLSLVASDLPGGLAVRANVRASYRYDDLAAGPPPLSVRAYEAVAVKSFTRVPLEIMVGRFGNPHESYSAYWDGALLRLGGRSGPGLGVVAGFEPELHNEGLSRALPKLTAFADFAARGGAWRYDTDASVHLLWPAGRAERRFVGWSQRVTAGPLALAQRLRVDQASGGGRWSLGDARLRASLDLGGSLRLRSTYRRARSTLPPIFGASGVTASPVRREVTVGLDLSGRRGSLSLESGRTDRDGRDAGLSMSAGAGVRVGAARLQLSGRRWTRAGAESLSVAPAVELRGSSWEWRAGYRFYRTRSGQSAIDAHAAEGRVGLSLGRGSRLTLRAERQWGAQLSGTRLQLGVWRSF